MNDASATVEAPAPRSLKVLKALVAVKEQEYAQLSETYTALWQQRKAASLPRERYIDFLWTEDRMGLLLKEVEALKPQVLAAEAEEAMTTGKAHYDAHCEPVTEAATMICSAWAAFMQACGQFVQEADEQIRLLWSMPDATGQPAFDLPDGQVLLQRLIQALPHQPATVIQSVVATLRVPMTVGDSHNVLAMVPGRQPFPETLVRRFLRGFQSDEPKPEEDV